MTIHVGDIWTYLQSAWILFWLGAAVICIVRWVVLNPVAKFFIIAVLAYILFTKMGIFVA